ncbi:MAG: YnbE family lipoprotein [Alphaproteobacteria bacterium]|nr:YnbE family lipoprotein [Alphaproteobacteria bacterium]MBP7758564.1 YnbE family lipoprotein [Alphaproteobacteria bacterium]MBP7761996.1 YnbE family lipoprotein [Alphaproteobacteria bacterium]MBP7904102.1 YnbE family lipoprotein [Alphaproteobacteria bacterium]
MKKIVLIPLSVLLLPACTPTVKVEAPDKPIEINMNVNIEHHVKVEIQRDVKDAINKNEDIF